MNKAKNLLNCSFSICKKVGSENSNKNSDAIANRKGLEEKHLGFLLNDMGKRLEAIFYLIGDGFFHFLTIGNHIAFHVMRKEEFRFHWVNGNKFRSPSVSAQDTQLKAHGKHKV